jgi:cation diffusion facilitator family transporter
MGIGVSVAAVGVGLGYKAIMSLLAGEPSHPETIAGIMAFASIVVKEILFRYTRAEGRKIRSQALEANAWHHRSDAFSSIPVLIAVVISLVFPQLWFADAVGALIVAFFVLRSAYEIASPGAKQLVDQGADVKVAKKLLELALGHPKVMSIHGFRTRYVGSDLHVDLHIVVDSQMSLMEAHDVAEEVEQLLIQADENVVDALVHVDPYDPKRADKKVE